MSDFGYTIPTAIAIALIIIGWILFFSAIFMG